MPSRLIIAFFATLCGAGFLCAQDAEVEDKELVRSSDAHMRDELGVNDITAPSIQEILKELGSFKPIPLEIIETNPRDANFENRLQTSLHFGSLVADGFMLTIAERPQDVQEIGKALIRQSRALGVGDRLTKRSKSLFEFSEKGNWAGMREELIKTQTDVEKSMLEMRDEEMAHMISLGGWLRGFQLAANSCVQNYSPERATVLGRGDIIDYYLDRLGTLHPRLKKTELVTALIAKLTALRAIAITGEGSPLKLEEIKQMRDLANEAEAVTIAPVDEEGRLLPKAKPALP